MTGSDESNIDWSLTTWKGSRLRQHREFLSLPFRRKLEVIEELANLARSFQDAAEPPPAPSVRENPSP